MTEINIAQIRKEYGSQKLSKKTVDPNPIRQFEIWLQEAIKSELAEPTAMQVSTVSPDGKPACRTVLLKGIENEAYIFYTNYDSRKGQHIASNPNVCLTFFWAELERQVHVEGSASKVSEGKSNEYFQSRPRKSRLGARISPQSQVIKSRNDIITAFVAESARYIGQKVPRPDNWGGYAIVPERIEFWQGRESRLHDRLLYTRDGKGDWKIDRLAP